MCDANTIFRMAQDHQAEQYAARKAIDLASQCEQANGGKSPLVAKGRRVILTLIASAIGLLSNSSH